MKHIHALGPQSARSTGGRRGRRKAISAIAAVVTTAAVCVGVAQAATTVGPTQPGSPPYTRADIVNVTVNPVAVQFSRTGLSTSAFTRSTVLTASCVGDDPATTNNSPRTVVTVTGPGTVGDVLQATSPVLKRSLSDAFAGYPVADPQPAPNATNWRGGAYGSTVSGAGTSTNNTRPWVVPVDLTGKPGGIYTVTTTTYNKIRTGPITNPGPCIDGQATHNGSGWTNAFTTGPLIETQTFEYRPWQKTFTDVLGNGNVKVNLTPQEFQGNIASPAKAGTIYSGTPATMKFYEVPDVSTALLPADPNTCAENPTSCLPSSAVQCTPGSAGCDPRLLVINKGVPGDVVQGLFDLETNAFVAKVVIEGSQRYMFSLGAADAHYRDLLTKLNTAAAGQGVDLGALMRTAVRLRLGNNEYKLSLLNGLQIDPKAAGVPNGVQIVTDPAVQAGLILNIYAGLGSPCASPSTGDSDPATAAPDRVTRTSNVGYTVEKSDLLPEVPRAGAAGALVGGPIYHIEGQFAGGTTLVNTSAAVIGVDTAEDEPNGYPIWIEPFLSSPAHVEVARTMDFIGTATWSASETNLGALGCLVVDFMLGAGVAIYNNPLPVGFGDIPIWDPQSPAVQELMAQVNAAVQDTVDDVASNPTVDGLLNQILGALPV
jgi:hypothetical protein